MDWFCKILLELKNKVIKSIETKNCISLVIKLIFINADQFKIDFLYV